MVVVTLADLAFRFRQFLIAVLGAGVVLAMALLLAGLVGGFRTETVAVVDGVGATRWVLADSSGGRIAAVAVFPEQEEATIARLPGVTAAAPLVLLPQEVARVAGRSQTVNLVGVTPGALGAPGVLTGHPLSGPGQVVVDDSTGAHLGGTVTVGTSRMRVVGLVDGRTLFGGSPVLYVGIGDAQRLSLGGRPLATAVVTRGVPTALPPGFAALDDRTVERNTLDALTPVISSLDNAKVLMWLVAAIIIAALLYVSALQRVRDFAVLKALGSSTAALLASLVLQATVVSLAAAGVAAVLSTFMGAIFAQPVSIPTGAYLTLPLIALAVGVLSSLVALRRVTRADPAAAFGG